LGTKLGKSNGSEKVREAGINAGKFSVLFGIEFRQFLPDISAGRRERPAVLLRQNPVVQNPEDAGVGLGADEPTAAGQHNEFGEQLFGWKNPGGWRSAGRTSFGFVFWGFCGEITG
jgi:hypothetical protein